MVASECLWAHSKVVVHFRRYVSIGIVMYTAHVAMAYLCFVLGL
jgi:hypothetical protein